jgi:hypothetical protein
MLAVSLALFLYGQWLWIIQTNGDAFIHGAAGLGSIAVALLVAGLYRRS